MKYVIAELIAEHSNEAEKWFFHIFGYAGGAYYASLPEAMEELGNDEWILSAYNSDRRSYFFYKEQIS